ncbi:MAG: TonB-dependent receptor [Alphaproteobacteria bacterium]|nr:TonB-dependent receptor [Alphaproteobacteria bacterium]MDE2163702.1 TonB-dependent receptor [Alphaproteobacteria bacterium]
MRTHAMWLGASALTLAWYSTALADAASSASTDQNSSATIETVVVTAERRTENLMTTPIAVDVLSGEDIAAKGVTSVDDLQFIAPTVTVDNFGQGIDFNIRGIGKGEHNSQTMTGVITYRDGVATFPGYFTGEPYYDIASIEVLRGPQGTFVGQSATGGAVLVNSNDPTIGGGYDGYAQAQYGNYNDGQLQGAVNIPISDTLAARVAVYGEARSSFYSITDSSAADNCPGQKYSGCKHSYNPGDLQIGAARVSVLWKPTEALTVSIKTDADYLDFGGYPASPYYEGFKTFPFGSTTPNPHYSDIFHITQNYANLGQDKFTRSVLKVDYVLPDGIKLRSVSGYQTGITNYKTDLDGTDYGSLASAGTPANWFFWDIVGESIWSQEFNLISPDNQRVTWVLGAWAQQDRYNYKSPYQFVIGQPANGSPDVLANNYELEGTTPNISWAGFGQVGFNVVSGLQLQLGARWTTEKTKNVDLNILQYGTLLSINQSEKSYSFDYKASLNWTINDNNFAYAFVSTGYKPGGLNVPVGIGTPAPFGPERVQSYETGWKATWLDGHMRTQMDAYYNNYQHFQVTIGYPAFPVFGFEVNDPKPSQIYGFEGETQASFGNLSFSAGVGLMHTALGGFYATDPRIPVALPCDPLTGPSNAFGTCVNLKGHPQTYAPDVSYNLSAEYRFDLGNGDTLTPRVNFSHQNPQYATLFDNQSQGDLLAARNILGAQLELKHNDYLLTLYSTNLTDQHYEAALNSGLRFAGAPRQFGIRLLKVW